MKCPDIELSFGACFVAAAGILILPLEWFLSTVAAAAIHEAGHLILLRIFEIPIHQIKISFMGAKIFTGPMSSVVELLCAAGGPLFSFLTVLLSQWFPLLGLTGFVQGLFNLIPIFPMDGGRICRSLAEIFREKILVRKISCKRSR